MSSTEDTRAGQNGIYDAPMNLPLVVALLLTAAGNSYFEQGKAQYEAMNYSRAVERLVLARDSSTASSEERRAILELLALAQSALGDMPGVEKTYTELVTFDPHTPVPVSAAPKLRSAFVRAKTNLYPPPYVRMELLPAPPERLRVGVTDPWGKVSRVVLTLAEGGKPFVDSSAPVEAHVASFVRNPLLSARFFIVAFDESNEAIATLGSREQPLERAGSWTEAPSAQEARSFGKSRSRWTWVLAGVAAVATGTAVGLSASSSADAATARGTRFGSDARFLNGRATGKAIAAYSLGGAAIAAGGTAAYMLWRW
jgi:hypothetical protein